MSMDDEDRLDRLLDAYVVEAPSAALRERISASAPKPRTRRPWFADGALWLSGAGLAVACAAGVLVGTDLGGAAALSGLNDADTAAAFGGPTAFDASVDVGQLG
jgi:hypothetical protein